MQAPSQPGQTVIVKSGCGKAATILGIIGALCFLALGGCFMVGMYGCGKVITEAAKESEAKEMAAGDLELIGFQWEKDGFGSVMTASFQIRNNGPKALKDIEIQAIHYAPSGTRIDSNSRTIYEVIQPGETKAFEKFNMGFIHSQADRSEARLKSAVPVTEAP